MKTLINLSAILAFSLQASAQSTTIQFKYFSIDNKPNYILGPLATNNILEFCDQQSGGALLKIEGTWHGSFYTISTPNSNPAMAMVNKLYCYQSTGEWFSINNLTKQGNTLKWHGNNNFDKNLMFEQTTFNEDGSVDIIEIPFDANKDYTQNLDANTTSTYITIIDKSTNTEVYRSKLILANNCNILYNVNTNQHFIKSNTQISKYEVVAINGNIVNTVFINSNNVIISNENLPKGMYLIKIYNEEGSIINTQKINL